MTNLPSGTVFVAPYSASPAGEVTEADVERAAAAAWDATCHPLTKFHSGNGPSGVERDRLFAMVRAALSTLPRAWPSDGYRLDDPEMDATDGAHPAWWRGHDHTAVVMLAQAVNALGRVPETGLHWQGALEAVRVLAQPSDAGAGKAQSIGAEKMRAVVLALCDTIALDAKQQHQATGEESWRTVVNTAILIVQRVKALMPTALALPPSAEPASEPFPYQKTFDAIAAATIAPMKGHVAISVIKFREAFGPMPSAEPAFAGMEVLPPGYAPTLAGPVPHPSAEPVGWRELNPELTVNPWEAELVWIWHKDWARGVSVGYYYEPHNQWRIVDRCCPGGWFAVGIPPSHYQDYERPTPPASEPAP